MNLKEFNSETSQRRIGDMSISFNVSGRIQLSRSFCDDRNIKKGDRISIHQDLDTPTDWYLELNTEKGLEIYFSESKHRKNHNFNSATTVKEIYKSLEWESKSMSMFIETQEYGLKGITLYKLVTAPYVKKMKIKRNEAGKFNGDNK